jgi:hypothetical protein
VSLFKVDEQDTQETTSRQRRVRGQDVVLSVCNLQMYHRMLFSRLVLDI